MVAVSKAVFGSTMIAGYRYDPETQNLDLEMQGGRTYTFRRVPQSVVDDFEKAESPGKFYHDELKGNYA